MISIELYSLWLYNLPLHSKTILMLISRHLALVLRSY